MLNKEQSRVFNEVIHSPGQTCIVHGKAGTGKSVLRDEFLSFIDSALCLGPTGISIEGSKFPDRAMTIAKFVRIANRPKPSVVVIDEMSMVRYMMCVRVDCFLT